MKSFFKSVRFRVWVLFIGFATAILIFLFISQVLLLPTYYEILKTNENMSTMADIKARWNDDDVFDFSSKIAEKRQIGIKFIFPETEATRSYSVTFDNSGNGRLAMTTSLKDEFFKQLTDASDGIIMQKFEEEGKQAILVSSYVGKPDNIEGYIFLTSYLEPLGTTTEILKNQFFISAGVVLIFAFLLSAFVVSGISNPIVKISKSAQKLTTGEFNMKVKPHDYAEISTLTENLNLASQEIARTETLRKDLMANISHDLKTPLTMIKAYAEMIRDLSGDNPEKRTKHVQVIIDEADRLNSLVMEILDLSKIQSGVTKLDRQTLDFSEHLNMLVGRFTYLKETGGYEIKYEIEPDIWINADVARLEQVVYNLIGNAINYTGENKTVTVRLKRTDGKHARFEVIDTGVGIAPEALPYIWDRYYKVNRSENHQRAVIGTGLGLSIVKGILEGHAFKYGVDSVIEKGSTFWFECETVSKSSSEKLTAIE